MRYEIVEEARQAKLSRMEASAFIREHGLQPADCYDEIGIKAEYTGEEILNWLGY